MHDHCTELQEQFRFREANFSCGDQHRALLNFNRGESDPVYRNGKWFLYVTIDTPIPEPAKGFDFIGVDLGVVAIAQTSDGTRFAGDQVNGTRSRHRRLRRKLQARGTRSAKRLLRKRRIKERRFAADINHQISKELVFVAQRTERGIALEDLKGIRERVRARKTQRKHVRNGNQSPNRVRVQSFRIVDQTQPVGGLALIPQSREVIGFENRTFEFRRLCTQKEPKAIAVSWSASSQRC